jgi:hypothetical protein
MAKVFGQMQAFVPICLSKPVGDRVAGIRAFIRDLKGKPAIHAGTAGHDGTQIVVTVDGETIILTPSEWEGLLVWGGPLPAGFSSRYP